MNYPISAKFPIKLAFVNSVDLTLHLIGQKVQVPQCVNEVYHEPEAADA